MSETTAPSSREQLISAFESVHREAAELFASFSQDDFFRRPEDGVWSPGENAVHLIKSVKAVADAMKLPKLLLRGLFGSASGSRRYSEVRELYLQVLAQGAVATGRFVPPSPPAGDDTGQSRSRALAGWRRAGASLVTVLAKWREPALDKYRLPHPIMGKISVREMLFFTHYHDLHHLEVVRRESPEVHAASAEEG